ncbi:hypothetical protein L596_005662 [Steinernema carpocapsae]|uniref:SPIN90/Ldb17 leucine-rich domain-containing protein n=1 Tax=Steinernema carpocapsae TaxID=34508 RepID=A0A4U8V005_STECR|nr:hypothetical protein L596_005662 [Steinernema carpocapsae]
MYRPQFDARCQAQNVLDILRMSTGCDMDTCKKAASFLISKLAETVNTSQDLCDVVTQFDRTDVVDVENCLDSTQFDECVGRLAEKVNERDGPGRSAYDSIDDMYLCTLLESIVENLVKADRTVVAHKMLSRFGFMDDIIRIYQISQNSILRSSVLKAFIDLSTVSDRIRPYLLTSNFVSDVALNTDLKHPDDAHTEKAVEFLGDVFECEEEPSELLYDHINADFVSDMITYGDCKHVMQFLMNFVRPRTIEIIAEAFRRLDHIRMYFGRVVAEYINTLSTSEDSRALKVFSVIYNARLSGKFFYANDLNVISGVVERIICNTSSHEMRLLALRVGARMLEIDGAFEYPQIISACQSLLIRDDLRPDEVRIANSVCNRL